MVEFTAIEFKTPALIAPDGSIIGVIPESGTLEAEDGERLGPDDRQQIRVLMVSFDAVRDTPDVLSAFKAEHHIQESNWIVAHASADDVRALAAALGIRYRELPDHTFNHSALISLADREGIVRARTGELAARDDAFMRAIHEQAAAKPAPR